ncbi:hypothetical protein [Actinoplanes couchii]|uniref:Uncharacterized protein n=1 Tax=Actinoplanes couchii TaxID=403638 RepID=A0ABQ3X2I6_9ACTN|nr:hypothetical protein [Actinoplanes couchii]MDR6322502.1 hypothetical protein [Actinoplanes couchii]GID52734.1 hypothetical protein Aco03nite_011380 [Actinoplanes couchii]
MTDEMERRLRSALAARAGQITPDRLRFEAPPTAAPARSFRFVFPSVPWVVGVSAVAVAAVVLGVTLRQGGSGTEPILPVAPPPSASVPQPVPSAFTPTPRPSPSGPAHASPRASTGADSTGADGASPATPAGPGAETVAPTSKPESGATSPAGRPEATPAG